MGCGGFTGDEMCGHYIEVDGPGSEAEVLQALDRLVDPDSTEVTEHCPPLVTLRGGRTIVFVDIAPDPDGPVLLAVGDLDDNDDARAEAAEAICATLSAQTTWRLRCSADTEGDVVSLRWAC
ncbi:MAG TPA: hypothetical protein VL595_29220 [Pseudonocardia sp.]|jgi:hypothetical protein|nr:hypothetical protein [Pseudonocardia sp.]